MANIKFYGTEDSETDRYLLTVHQNSDNEIYLNISDMDCVEDFSSSICLDKETALLLLAKLTNEINEIK